jgi:phosphoribosyl 1,2-cyclic phosphodiesterase
MTYRVTFWGTRGSIPVRYGGNTPCVSLEHLDRDAKAILILDSGTGIRPLGNTLVERSGQMVEVDLLVSHTHWDHIQGLPFFTPLFDGSNAVRIWGPKQGKVDLEEILRNQMHPVVFPVPLDGLAAQLSVSHIDSQVVELSGFTVDSMRVRHPGQTLGYRLTPIGGGTSLGYVTDNELGPGGEYEVGPSWRAEFVRFLHGVDVLIHDAMYTPAEIGQHRGWGHSSYEEAVDLAAEAEVGQLVLFHHRPEHDDAAMDALVEAARKMADRTARSLDVVAAREDTQLTL